MPAAKVYERVTETSRELRRSLTFARQSLTKLTPVGDTHHEDIDLTLSLEEAQRHLRAAIDFLEEAIALEEYEELPEARVVR